jgi:hypothetical protein
MSISNISNLQISDINLIKCLICEEDYKNEDFILPCKCKICKDCFIEWLISENKENYLKFELEKKCPNHLCLRKIQIDNLFHFFKKEEMNKINNILFNKYLINQSDIRKCPIKECEYAAWFNPILNQNCEENYICAKCNFSWKDDSNNKSSFKEFLNHPINFITKDLSNINIKIFSKPCPKCTIQIYKFTGCDSVKCPRCDLEFCYNCNKIHENLEVILLCSLKSLLIFFYFFYIIFITLAKIYLTSNLFFMICNYYLFFILINLIYFFYAILLNAFFVTIYRLIRGITAKSYLVICFIFFSTIIIFLHIYYLIYSEMIQFYTKIFFLELFLIFTISIITYFFLMLYKKIRNKKLKNN